MIGNTINRLYLQRWLLKDAHVRTGKRNKLKRCVAKKRDQ